MTNIERAVKKTLKISVHYITNREGVKASQSTVRLGTEPLWTDETKINLFQSDGKAKVRRKKGSAHYPSKKNSFDDKQSAKKRVVEYKKDIGATGGGQSRKELSPRTDRQRHWALQHSTFQSQNKAGPIEHQIDSTNQNQLTEIKKNCCLWKPNR